MSRRVSRSFAAVGVALAALLPGPSVLSAQPAAVDAASSPAGEARATPAPKPTGEMRLVARGKSGASPNAAVLSAALSPGGTMVAFWSKATNLFPGVNDGGAHLYLARVSTGRVFAVADTTSSGAVASEPSTYDDARAIAWGPKERGYDDAIFVAFASMDHTLAPGATQYLGPHLYVKNLVTDETTWLLDGVLEAQWSPKRTRMAVVTSQSVRYGSAPVSTEMVWMLDLLRDPSELGYLNAVSMTSSGGWPNQYDHSSQPQWSPNGKRILFTSKAALQPGDTNGASDVYMYTVAGGAVQRVSVGDATTKRRAQGNDLSRDGVWSPDGGSIAFSSQADNLVRGDTDKAQSVFLRNLSTGKVTIVSTTSAGRPSTDYLPSYRPVFSPDGTRIAFMSKAWNLLPSPLEVRPPSGSLPFAHVYVKWLGSGAVQIASVTAKGRYGNSDSDLYAGGLQAVQWLPRGKGLLMLSRASNFSKVDGNFRFDVYLKML